MSNPLIDILSASPQNIPCHFDDDLRTPYVQKLREQFSSFLNQIIDADEIFFVGDSKLGGIDGISYLQNKLLKVLEIYYNGYPAKAYDTFSKCIDDTRFNISDQLTHLQFVQKPRISKFFRCQTNYNELAPSELNLIGFFGSKNPYDLFHTPFERRRSIPTYRFSIPGYPCLYLSDKLCTSYSECFPEKEAEYVFFQSAIKIAALYTF